MSDRPPKVSIGLAVFNGEKYLKEAIDSILAQTFTDFELIISDNASTDRTEEICRDYLAKDKRIRYYRNSTNIGGTNNENRTFQLSRGQYFRLAAHDDVLAPELIEKCVEILDADSSIVLCHSQIVHIDENGNYLKTVDQSELGSSCDRCDRFRSLLRWEEHACEASYGAIRSDILQKTELQPNYPNSDRTFLAELSLYGKFYQLPEPLFFKRFHPEMSTQVFFSNHSRIAWHNPDTDKFYQSHFLLKHFKDLIQYFQYYSLHQSHCFRVVSRANLTFIERIICYLHVSKYMLSDFVRDGIPSVGRTLFIRKSTLLVVIEFGKFLLNSFNSPKEKY